MTKKIPIHDQTAARQGQMALVIDWDVGVPCSARRLILERVENEYESFYSVDDPEPINPLISLSITARLPLDEVKDRALKGFSQNAFLLFVDKEQATDLDTEFLISPGSDIKFVRLLPLKGG